MQLSNDMLRQVSQNSNLKGDSAQWAGPGNIGCCAASDRSVVDASQLVDASANLPEQRLPQVDRKNTGLISHRQQTASPLQAVRGQCAPYRHRTFLVSGVETRDRLANSLSRSPGWANGRAGCMACAALAIRNWCEAEADFVDE